MPPAPPHNSRALGPANTYEEERLAEGDHDDAMKETDVPNWSCNC
ncbi:hypothetical protein CLAFUW4_14826 [Fulvia fulva]|nr:hypothetical protein CLAFUR0_14819 [Fulvia fulva]WPV22999.1 hypothetical protein CLAFUW4_14826 [Fulvia fulva]WPV37952.1 hypothetical protein CLAFUW7_14827 [Fulvia fulva]